MKKRGHNVPEADVRRRFSRSITNFLNQYRSLVDSWILFDNSMGPLSVIAFQEHGEVRIMEKGTYNLVVANYGNK